ncbi:MAG: TIM barrel protein [Bryobacteraceae bacterium]|nr:TIM barrel protein [Bryobacteraceae bacterium]
MNRRTFTALAAAGTAHATPPKSQLGVATTCYLSYWRPRDMDEFLTYCHSIGAGGVQSGLPKDPKAYRARCEQLGMWYEAMLPLNDNLPAAIEQAKLTGAVAGRVGALSGRRYETFDTMAKWQAFVADSRAKIAMASKAAAAAKFPIALENHKDWTLEEMLGLMKEFGHEHFGVLLDTGNNIALLDDPYAIVEQLAPYALSTHLKDMAWQKHPSGFEMSEMPFGEGTLDMKRMIDTIRKARPATKMTLEMITRNPLVVPCLTAKYWVTMPNRPAPFLAGTLNAVENLKPRQPLPTMDKLDADQRLRHEADNVKWCLNVAREKYGL